MICSHIIDLAASALVVGPLDRHPWCRRLVVCDAVVVDGGFSESVGALELIPGIVRKSVAVLILHNPHCACLSIFFREVRSDAYFVTAVVVDAVVEPDNHITSEPA